MVPPDRKQGPNGSVIRAFEGAVCTDAFKHLGNGSWSDGGEGTAEEHQHEGLDHAASDRSGTTRQLTHCFLRLANLDSGVFEPSIAMKPLCGGRPYRRYSLFIRSDNAERPVAG